ncbi:MAG: twin-arginine translocation pathway signal protein [Rhizobiaceae bacterium]|nr:twin-arginine translocation pathway signal protein [Rhizobiaceae bacterium]
MNTLNTIALGLMLVFGSMIGVQGAFAESGAFKGTFRGLNKHVTTGSVSILKTENGGSVLILGPDFSLDGAPDPSVALGKNGKYDRAANLGNMTKINGHQVYMIPDDLDWSTYNEVYIWCEKFNVGLGVASIK